MFSPVRFFNTQKAKVFEKYHQNPGGMLVHTGAIGWILSSLAQISALYFNKKLSPEDKMFLIPQEVGDAAVNIISFYTFTAGVKSIGTRLTRTAKIRTAELSKILKERGLILEKNQVREAGKTYAGDWDFNLEKLDDYETAIKPFYKPFNNGAEVLTGLAGSILSSNMITPILRNHYAANRQKQMITHYNNWKDSQQNGTPYVSPYKVTLDNFRTRAASHIYGNSGMKV